MSTQRNATALSWPQLQGRVVGDGYRLVRYLDGAETTGRFEGRIDGSEGRRVMVQLFALSPRQARERLELWRTLQLLNRPDILKILVSGSADWPDLHFDYVVTEFPDESLGEVLAYRTLDEQEARQMLESVAAALAVMHDRHCVHASVQPANIYAVGDAIKLSVATVQHPGASDILAEPSDYQAPEVSSFAFSPASDIWSLGVTLFQALTRELPGDDAAERSAPFSPQFREILKHSLDPISAKRWTAQQILESLGAPTPERPPVLEAMPSWARIDEEHTTRGPVSLLAIAAIVLFLVFLWLVFGRVRKPGPPALSIAQPAPAQAPVVGSPTRPSPSARAAMPTPPTRKPISQKEKVPVPTPSASANGSDAGPINWRVIAFTFNRETDAAHKAFTINASHPDLHAAVFSPQPGHFLVAVGGWMAMENAKRFREQAISEGLPRDSYAQNFRR